MRIDLDSLGTFYEMARRGAGLAASRLTALTGIDTRVRVSRVDFRRRSELRDELDESSGYAGIRTTLSGGMAGDAVVLFDRESALRVVRIVTEDLEGIDESLVESAVVETGQIINNGFIDGWANVLDTEVDATVPTYVAGSSADEVLDGTEATTVEDGLAVAFNSTVEAIGEEVSFRHYFLPEAGAVGEMFGGDGDRSIELSKLAGFDEMAQRGADAIAQDVTTLTGTPVDVDVRRINFVSLAAIPAVVPTEPLVSVAFSFDGPLSGYLLFVFDEAGADQLAADALGTNDVAEAGPELRQDAVQELSNIMASGMLDGWANLLDDTISHSTPAYANDIGAAAVDPLVVGLAEEQSFAFVFDSRMRARDTDLDFDVYVIPSAADLTATLDALDIAQVDETPTAASTEIPEGAADPSGFTDQHGDI